MFNSKKKIKIDWVWGVIFVSLILIFLSFCYLNGLKMSEGKNEVINYDSTNNEGEEEGPPGWLGDVIDSLIAGIIGGIQLILDGLLGTWLKTLIILPILLFLTAFSLIIFQLSGGSFIGSQISEGTESYIYFNVPLMFLVVTIASIFIFVVISTINVLICVYSTKTDKAKLKNSLNNIIQGGFAFVMLPIIFLGVVMCLNSILTLVNYAVTSATGSEDFQYSVSDSIANLGFESPVIFTGTGIERWKSAISDSSYQVLFPTICSVLFLVGYAMMTITIIQQLYQLLILYFLSALSLINYTNDEGQMFKQVLGQFKNKMITNFSIILGVQLYGYINPMIMAFSAGLSDDSIVNLFLQVVTLVAGLMFMMGFPTFIGQFTGETLNMNEGKAGLGMITRSAINPVGSIASKSSNMMKNSSRYQAKQQFKKDFTEKRAKDKAAFMQMKGKGKSVYAKHNAWVDKKVDKMNKTHGG